MEELPRAPSKCMYSWWWDSHISPKNSKWLQENLNDMDSKVKAMIKLIEEDADSFARRAEMYYKKRPELMKLVEEFYRAYRALAERYDNATGVLRQAQRTMAEAFPNQDPLEINDNIPENKTPEIHENLVDLLGEEKVRKGLDFCEDLSESEVVSKFENEIRALKDALAQLELEKEAGIIQYENILEKMSKLESEFSRAQEISRELNDRANFAEGGVQVLRDSLNKLAAEKEASFLEYQKSLEKITNLEKNVFQAKEEVEVLNERACKAESEKDEALNKYKQSLENVSNFEKKIKVAEQDAKQLSVRAENAEKEVETLKQALAKLTEENEFNILQYRKCLEKISNLEHELSCAEEEVRKLKKEIEFGVTKLKNKEEMCLTLEKSNQALDSELGSLVLKMGSQTEKLSEKEKELGKIWSSLQEERNRFIRVENNFEKLQKLHLQTQDQLKSIGSELEKKGELLKEIETRNESLSNEITRINEENKSLNECNLFSSMTIKDMQSEISGLIKSKNKLSKNRIILEQVEAVGLNPKNFESSVKQLQAENSDLKEIFEEEKAEKLLVLKKMETMKQLFEKNELLEKSLSDLNDELEKARGKIISLEQSFEALLVEKSVILGEKKAVMSQLQAIIETFEKINEKKNCLENKPEGSRARSKTLEDFCESLEKVKFYLIKEKDSLVSQGETTQISLEDLGKRQMELEDKYSGLEKEGELTFSKLEKFRFSLDLEKNDHSNFAQRTETQLSGMEKQIYLLQEEVFSGRREFEQELDKVIDYQLEIFILRNCLNDLKENNSSLLTECQKLKEASKFSENLISGLKHENIEKQIELKSLSDKINMFNMGMRELSEAIGVDLGRRFEDDLAGDPKYLKYLVSKLEENKNENQRLNIKICVMKNSLMQLRLHANTLATERENFDKELNNKNEELFLSQNEAKKLLELNGDLNLKVSELTSLVTMMKTEIDKINMVNNNRKNQFHKLSEENVCLRKENMKLEIKAKNLQEEWDGELEKMFGVMQYSTVFQVLLENKFYEFKKVINSKDEQIEVLEGKIGYLEGENGRLETQLAAYSPLIISLKDSISSLESRILRYKLQKIHNEGAKEKNEISDEKVLDAYSELKDMLFKINVIERVVAQKERLVAQENLNSNTKLEASKKSIEGLKIRGCANREYSVPIYDNSEFEDEITTKDIMLDKNSESSSHELSRRGERKHRSKRVESWDLADLDRSIDLTIGRDKRVKSSSEPLKREKNKYRNMDIEAEKELGVDKLEISRTFSQRSQEANKTKIMERLNSDAEKLNNLEITVQDMRKKVEITENGKKGKAVYVSDTLREKLEEAEEAIIELFDFNGKLMRSVAKRSFSSNLKLGVDLEENGSARRRRIAEQVRKVSEKIGRWQMEVQKIQILVMKNEKEIKNKTRVTELRKRILLRDYLYGGLRTPSHELRRKKSSFCGCVRPSIRGD